MRLGFAGLGLMGAPMAANLLRARHRLAVYNRSEAPRLALATLGAKAFSDAADLFAACDAVILMLADDEATDRVLGRGMADFAARVSGRLIVNMGTHAPAWSKALEADVAAAGGRFVEAPVSGSRGPAEAGALVAMVAGEAEAVEVARPLLAPLCREVVATGAVPSAMACKMAINLYLIASVAALDTSALVLTDGPWTTAGAAMAQMDLMVGLVARYAGSGIAESCARTMVLDLRHSQVPYIAMSLLAASNEGVARAAAWARPRLGDGIGVNDLARAAGQSPRTFSRRIVAATGLSPIQFLQQLRVERAIELIEATALPFEEIAHRVGYSDPSTLRILLRRGAGAGPRELRAKARAADACASTQGLGVPLLAGAAS